MLGNNNKIILCNQNEIKRLIPGATQFSLFLPELDKLMKAISAEVACNN